MAIQAGETTFYQAKRGIVQDGLVLNLDAAVDASYNGGTTWRDLAGSNNGTLTNGPTFSSENGGSIVFDGTDDYVDIEDSVADRLTNGYNITLSTFSNLTSLAGYGSILLGMSNGSTRAFFQLGASTWYFGTTDPVNYTYGGYSSPTNIPVLITFVQNSNNIYLYVNDLLVGSSTSKINDFSAYSNIRFGTHVVGGWEHTGETYTVYLYNRALTSDEVARNYNATRHRFGV